MTNQQINQLKTKITQLQKEKEQLKILLHELLETFYKSISQEKSSTTWTFNPDLEQLFKNFAKFKTCSHSQTNGKFTANNFQPNECHWDQMKDFFTKMKGEHE